MPIKPLGPKLSADLLARRSTVPKKPVRIELAGARVALRPYEPADGVELFAISDGRPVTRVGRTIDAYDADELIWRFMPAGPFPSAAALVAYHDLVADLHDSRTFSVADRQTGQLLGSASYMSNAPEHLKIEIGNVWCSPPAQGAGINAETTRLLIAHAFGLGYQRIEWKCHTENERSRLAASRLGFTFEGVQEAHLIQKGRRRDTAWYRLLPGEPIR
jgi:RimJ/RimL family protein N-acetyltransferase